MDTNMNEWTMANSDMQILRIENAEAQRLELRSFNFNWSLESRDSLYFTRYNAS